MATLIDSRQAVRPRYAELRCRTHYSFLRGASSPEEMVKRAAELGMDALAITDLHGVYGLPKAFLACKGLSSEQSRRFKLITGSELAIASGSETPQFLTLLSRNRAGYGLMCRLLSASHAGREKGDARLEWAQVREMLDAYPDARTGLIAIAPEELTHAHQGALGELKDLLGSESVAISLCRMLDGRDRMRTEQVLKIAEQNGVRVVATGDVHYHAPSRRVLQDVMTGIREGVTLKDAGKRLFSNAERYLKSPAQMAELFSDLPDALQASLDLADRCSFSLSELKYRYPSEWIPEGETAQSYLEHLTLEGARRRYPGGVPDAVVRQIQHELRLISELGFADYFLTIWEIVEFARSKKILCQGRGSAANSVVCYCLGITAVDPVRMDLLFERFISAERGEPPDIDVDFEHDRREEVIQHIYERYGRDRATMVAAVITYRSRLSKREVCKVLDCSLDQPTELAEKVADELYGAPRHLSIHSGGFTLSADPLIEVVPIEPARMEGRTIVQWDKYDLDAVGLLKVDLLSLGMLSAIRRTIDLMNHRRKRELQPTWEFAQIPAEDPETYEMICRSDTVGVFQIESRAQMSMLPRLQPRTFYDLVIEVAIVRPGPIVGKMVHPYLRRRRGQEAVDMPHPALEPILARTLGVPIFQEQVMKMAVALAGFTPGEADRLRRAIGAWRSSGEIEVMGQKLMAGLLASGVPREFVDRVFEQIKGFAEYGFPESHAVSFALITYASCYLKQHYPAEFCCALINSQPMGFYSIHTLIDDAKRHGVAVLPVHPNHSTWDCTMEFWEGEWVLQLGWRVVHGLARLNADRMILERKSQGEFRSLAEFMARVRLKPQVLERLALADAFKCFGEEGREALWNTLDQTSQLELFRPGTESSGMVVAPAENWSPPAMSVWEKIQADYAAYRLSTRGHPMLALRPAFDRIKGALKVVSTASVKQVPHGTRVRVAGLVIVRQSPGNAKGVTFATLEDETGFIDMVLWADVREKYDDAFLGASLLLITGKLQRDGLAVSLMVQKIEVISPDAALRAPLAYVLPRSRDFR